jgi:HEAT repeat protein
MLLNADSAIKDRVLKPLCERLLDPNEDLYVRCKISDALGQVLKTGPGGVPLPGDQIGFNTLDRIAAGKEDTALVGATLRAMGRAGHKAAVQMIVRVVSEPNANQDLKAAALDALEYVLLAGVRITGTDDLIRTLVAMLTDDKVSPDLRVRAARVLGRAIQGGGANSSAVAGAVASALDKTADPEIAASLVAVLGGVPEEASVRALKQAYAVFSKSVSDTKEYQKVRILIAKGLGEYFQPFARKGQTSAGADVAEVLYTILSKDANPEVLNAAAYALGNMSDARYDRTKVVAKLIDMLGDPKVKEAAYKSLKVITINRDFGTKPEDWKAWVDGNKSFLLPKG